MSRKNLFIVLCACAVISLIAVACSDTTKSPTQATDPPADILTNPGDQSEIRNEAAAFTQALLEGKYRFSVDENGALIPYDGIHIPEGEEELYAAFLKLSEIPGRERQPASIAASKLPNDWRWACWREICYALSRTKYLAGQLGQSRRAYLWNNAWWLAGDWNYDGLGYGRGGQCKYFASRIVTRATGGRYSLPGGYYYATGDISWCQPGDVIQRSPDYGLQHTAIVFAVLARDSNGRATKVDVIDANFVNYPYEMIARHYLPYGSYKLDQFKVW